MMPGWVRTASSIEANVTPLAASPGSRCDVTTVELCWIANPARFPTSPAAASTSGRIWSRFGASDSPSASAMGPFTKRTDLRQKFYQSGRISFRELRTRGEGALLQDSAGAGYRSATGREEGCSLSRRHGFRMRALPLVALAGLV